MPLIESERLLLVPMTAAFLEASLDGRRDAVSEMLGASVAEEWLSETSLMQLRLDQLRARPELDAWLLRAVVHPQERRMLGHVGFHSDPDPAYLQELAPGGVEMGYTIYPGYRRNGYATEACRAQLEWARRTHHVRRFILSISPENEPSLRIARRLGFRKVCEHQDPEEGIEHVFLLEMD